MKHLLLLIAALLLTGCNQPTPPPADITALEARIAALEKQNAALNAVMLETFTKGFTIGDDKTFTWIRPGAITVSGPERRIDLNTGITAAIWINEGIGKDGKDTPALMFHLGRTHPWIEFYGHGKQARITMHPDTGEINTFLTRP
mgnify:CR=1 FL=1